MKVVKTILVVCIGNICRSPMAEALLAAALPDLSVSSAGTGALVGQPADAAAVQLMDARGLNISAHRARQIGSTLCQQADLILVMDQAQRRHLESLYPQVRGKVFRIGELAKQDVPDPYRRGPEAFKLALALIETGVNVWVERIQKAR